MHELHVALVVLGGLVLLLGFLSVPIERFAISRPTVALAAGIVLGPDVLGVITRDGWMSDRHSVIEATATLTIAIAVMGVALHLPARYFRDQARTMLVALGLAMPLMAVASSALAWAVLGISPWLALLVGAIITPTDPVLSMTVVQGAVARDNLPKRVRDALAAEAGANDGLAYFLVFAPVTMTSLWPPSGVGTWLVDIVLIDVLGAVALGVGLGVATGLATREAERRGAIENASLLAVTLALTVLTLGLGELLDLNGLIAVFAAGIGFDNAATFKERKGDEKIQESINQFFTVPVFAVVGLFLPWREWLALGWPGLVLVVLVLVLLLRRLPPFLLLGRWMPAYRGLREVAFAGWFGPIGIAAIYYANLMEHRTGHAELWTITTLVVTASLVVHGITSSPLTKLLGRHPAQT